MGSVDAIQTKGCPSYISFDHDLGESTATGQPLESGFDLAKWLVNSDLDGTITIPSDFKYDIHSANPVGVANIRGLLDKYLRFRADQENT